VRAVMGCLACVAAMLSAAFAASQSDPAPIYLHGFYELDRHPTWRLSDAAPWNVVKDAPWANPRLVKWGYVPVTHDSRHYYCLIDYSPRTGSHISELTFMCGDPATAEWLFNNNWRPVGRLYGPP
jgi:hypothetical protein